MRSNFLFELIENKNMNLEGNKWIIFYFTGTGNSLIVAQDIADKIGDTMLM